MPLASPRLATLSSRAAAPTRPGSRWSGKILIGIDTLVRILDISDSARPDLVGQILTPDLAPDVHATRKHAYAPVLGNGLQVIRERPLDRAVFAPSAVR